MDGALNVLVTSTVAYSTSAKVSFPSDSRRASFCSFAFMSETRRITPPTHSHGQRMVEAMRNVIWSDLTNPLVCGPLYTQQGNLGRGARECPNTLTGEVGIASVALATTVRSDQ